MDPTLEFLFLVAVLLAVALLLRRQGTGKEKSPTKVRASAPQPPPAEAPAKLNADADTDTWALLVAPLNAILQQCERARGQRKLDPRLEEIERNAAHMRDLLARVPGADRRIEEELEQVDPEAALRAAVDSYSGLALDREMKVQVFSEPVPRVRTNPRLLQRALRHLVRTALTSAEPRRGHVTATVGLLPEGKNPTHVALAVTDDGPGLEPSRLVRILDPLVEEEAEPNAEELAYSVASALARSMGAQFTMTSAAGSGTRAAIKIRLDRAALRQLREMRAPAEV
jgi:signal transduction histidine kinase